MKLFIIMIETFFIKKQFICYLIFYYKNKSLIFDYIPHILSEKPIQWYIIPSEEGNGLPPVNKQNICAYKFTKTYD